MLFYRVVTKVASKNRDLTGVLNSVIRNNFFMKIFIKYLIKYLGITGGPCLVQIVVEILKPCGVNVLFGVPDHPRFTWT